MGPELAFLFPQNVQTGSGAHQVSVFNGYRGLEGLGRATDHTSPYIAEFENEWSSTSTLPICLHMVHRNNYTATFHSINQALSVQVSNGSSRPIVRRLVASLAVAKLNRAAFRLCVFSNATDILILMILYDLFPLP